MPSLTIRQLITRLSEGTIRVPAFQRGFVWTNDSVAFLMDSIFRGYPIGTLLLWRTREPLTKERDLGPFTLPEPQKDWPIDYVLDGQQRITSLFGVFQTALPPASQGDWFDIYFDLDAPQGALEDQFVALSPDDAKAARYFPLRSVLDTTAFFEAASHLGPDVRERIVDLQRRFQEAQISTELVEFEDRDQIAIIFERVNRAGVQLDAFQLLSAWTWSTEFDLNEALAELQREIEPFGFSEFADDPNLFMKCCASVVTGTATIDAVVNLHGPTVREQFSKIRSGILGSIEFLRREFEVQSLALLPYPAMIVPLCRFFSTDAVAGYHPSGPQTAELRRWFWRSCFSRRYSSGIGRAHATDIAAMDRLKRNETENISDFGETVFPEFFLQNSFSLGSVNTRTHVLLLASHKPVSLLSAAPIDLGKVLQRANRNEFHHLFPRAYLNRTGIPTADQNILANVSFLSSADNNRIKDKAPADYAKLMSGDKIAAISDANFLPATWATQNYGVFTKLRASLLATAANRLTEHVDWLAKR